MFKTLRSKVTIVLLALVITTAIVGIVAVANIYNLSKVIDGMMLDNYNSIKAVNNMIEALDEQNNSILIYIDLDKEEGINSFYKYDGVFGDWSNIERNNITEKQEKEYVNSIDNYHVEYIKLFSKIQEIKNNKGEAAAIDFYHTNVNQVFTKMKEDLKSLTTLNENAMFNEKNNLTNYAKKSMYIISSLAIVLVLAGGFLSRVLIVKIFKPVYHLRENIKAIKAGDLNHQYPVFSQDEIGELIMEFNKMTVRLRQYEESNIGKLVMERTKSLAIVKSIYNPIIVMDMEYKITLLNDSCEKYLGITEEKSLNKYFQEVMHNEELYNYILEMIKKENISGEAKVICINNNYFNIIVTLLKDTDNKINGMVVLFQNITELKQLERIKTEFVSNISHEFKTPLTSIMIGTSLILDENVGELNKKQKEIILAIKEDGEHLADLVNDILQLSKIESKRTFFDFKAYSIIGIIENSVREFYERAENKEVHLHYEVEDYLPKIIADNEKITWVMNNLLINALKYTNAGDEILVSAYAERKIMYISVKDTGMGIPEEYLDKIFNRFVQVENQDSEKRGTGLGLTICREIVQAHGGEIWCESKLDEGSKFTFTVPIAEELD